MTSAIALGVEYDGSAFHGWQRQSNVPTVQQTLETALSKVADEPIRVVAAGRTDAGVHATGQIIGFRTAAERQDKAWLLGVNALCPHSLRVQWVAHPSAQFHARRSAAYRRYLYLLNTHPSALTHGHVTTAGPLDDECMHRAAQPLVGEHDFSAFRGAGCQSQTPIRRVHRIQVTRRGDFVIVDVIANAFLLHMVRNLVGSLMEVGRYRQGEEWVDALLRGRDRRLAAPTAHPDGLYLVHVHYPNETFPAPIPPPLLQAFGTLDQV